MATILNTTQEYLAADVVTHTNLNNIIGGTTFQTGVDGATDDVSLEVATGGSLRIKDDGVTTPKILDANVTKAKLEDISAPLRLLGRTTAGAGAPEEVTVNDDDDLSSASAITLATDESIKAYIDKLKPNVSQFIKTDKYINLNPGDAWHDFSFEVSITPKFDNSKIRIKSSINNSTNHNTYTNLFKLMKKVGSGSFADLESSFGDLDGSRVRCTMYGNNYPGYGGTPSVCDFIDDDTHTAGTQITYKMEVYGTTTVDININSGGSDANSSYAGTPASTFTVEEIYQ